MRTCQFEGCDRELRPGSKLPSCSVCRANIGGWSRRSPSDIEARRVKVRLYGLRMVEVTPRRRK
jgi:hypothetical protein